MITISEFSKSIEIWTQFPAGASTLIVIVESKGAKFVLKYIQLPEIFRKSKNYYIIFGKSKTIIVFGSILESLKDYFKND